ncbi:MAG: DNA alkylation repair protein [Carboxylicivirga sp.]|nr:DNA alkylation repair protein [Carboxylicivirga sp.]
MAELFKNLYSPQFFDVFTEALDAVIDHFDKESFLKKVYVAEWEDMELKQRMHHISMLMATYLSNDYKSSIEQIHEIIAVLKENDVDNRVKYRDLVFILLPNYIEHYGINDFQASVEAFRGITPFSTCELAVRPFIIKFEDQMMERLQEWTKDTNHHVRRLASEGCRPRLPWGMALRAFKSDPSPILPILEALKNDPTEYVRKSVANNLNDISKDNPQTTIDIAKRWKGQSKETDWIVKHACRTLLKAGNQEMMKLFGYGSIENIEIQNFELSSSFVRVGDALEFSFDLNNHSDKSELIRLEYAIYFLKKNGSRTKKVFKISEKNYPPHSSTSMSRKQSFKLVSTRKYHLGEHLVSLIINGVEVEEGSFELKE